MTDGVYLDLVDATRCTHCQSVLRQGGEPMVAIRLMDAEVFARMLAASFTWLAPTDAEAALLKRLERAVGRTLRQMEAS